MHIWISFLEFFMIIILYHVSFSYEEKAEIVKKTFQRKRTLHGFLNEGSCTDIF